MKEFDIPEEAFVPMMGQSKSRLRQISPEQKKSIWAASIDYRADEVGATKEQIVRDVLVRLGVEHTGDVPDYEKRCASLPTGSRT